MYHGFHKNVKQHNCFQLFDNNNKCFLGSKDWSDDAENSALHHRITLRFKLYSNTYLKFDFFKNYFYNLFWAN